MEPGGHYRDKLLTKYRAAWAIIRQWAGLDAAVAAPEQRTRDLEQLLPRAMLDFRRPDTDPLRVAARIERALRGR
jgi:hypothetical protein